MLVIFHESQEYFDSVRKWAEEHGLLDKFEKAIDYCRNYGCHPDAEDPERCRVTLWKDWAPQSFEFRIEGRSSPTAPYKFWMNGGLIYQGPDSPADGGAPSFTVGLHDDIGWFMHT